MRFVVLGTSRFALECARAIVDSGETLVALGSMSQAARPHNSADFGSYARVWEVVYQELDEINSPDSVEWLRRQAADYLFVSWPKILKREALQSARLGVIGTHPAEVPRHRGRHSLHWLIVLGFEQSKVSFFEMDEGIDTGKLLLSVPYRLDPAQPIGAAADALEGAGYRGMRELCQKLKAGPLPGIAQAEERANYWRKRTPHDVTLDFRMSAEAIVRTVRSFAPPYPGANLLVEKQLIKIGRAEIIAGGPEVADMEHGKIAAIGPNWLRVKADGGLVQLESLAALPARIAELQYIHPPTKYLLEWPSELAEQLQR